MASEHKKELSEELVYLLLMAKTKAGLAEQAIDLVDLVLKDGSIAINQIILDSRFLMRLDDEEVEPENIKEIKLRR